MSENSNVMRKVLPGAYINFTSNPNNILTNVNNNCSEQGVILKDNERIYQFGTVESTLSMNNVLDATCYGAIE